MRHDASGTATLALCLPAGSAFAAATTSAAETPLPSLESAMLADAATRSSLAAASGGAGHDEGFFLEDAEGRFRLDFSGLIEFRFTGTLVDDDGGTDEDASVSGFELPTVEFELAGHVLDLRLLYAVEAEFDGDEDGTLMLAELLVGYELDEGLTVAVGQVQLPVVWEDVLDGEDALAVDTSVVANLFAPGDAQAVWVEATGERARGWLGFGFGAESENLPFDEAPAEHAFTGRAELLLAGDWDGLESMSSPPGSELAAKLGVAGHWQENRDRSAGADPAPLPYTVDLQVAGDGWNAHAAYVGRFLDAPAGDEDFHDIGLVVQGGVFLPGTDVELFARYDVVIPDGDRELDDTFGTITAGASWYVPRRAARLSVDVQWFLDDPAGNELVRDFAADDGPGLGLLPSDEPGRLTLRGQLQLPF